MNDDEFLEHMLLHPAVPADDYSNHFGDTDRLDRLTQDDIDTGPLATPTEPLEAPSAGWFGGFFSGGGLW